MLTHAHLIAAAIQWLRHDYRCGVILSEQACSSGEVPDVIGWKGKCHSVLVECKVSRSDFLADFQKPFRRDAALGVGCERYFLTPASLLAPDELPARWGLLELSGGSVQVVRRSARKLRAPAGLQNEMNLLLASLRRVEIRIEPQTITDFLKWKNRLAQYNGGRLPAELRAASEELNGYL